MKGGRLENHRWLFYDLSLQQGSVSHKEITAYKKKHAMHHCIKALKISRPYAHDQTIGTKQPPSHITCKTARV